VRFPECEREIYEVISSVVARKGKVSLEKTMRGRSLFSPTDMNRQFSGAFSARGYVALRDTYTITLPNSPVAIAGAYKQIDFVSGLPYCLPLARAFWAIPAVWLICYWYSASQPFEDGIILSHVAILLGGCLLCLGMGLVAFHRRDILA